MEDEDKYSQYANLPIPTYEEATSSRPASSQDHRGAAEISDDAERQGLLGRGEQDGHRHATVLSARSSEDSDLHLPEVELRGDGDRRQIEELDYLDPSADEPRRQRGTYHRARIRSQFSKRFANISATFSSLRLPSFRSLYTPVSNDTESTTPPSRFASLTHLLHHISIPQQCRISGPTFARFCGLFTIVAVVYALFATDIFPGNGTRLSGRFPPEGVRMFVQDTASGHRIRDHLRHITSYDHVAGTEGDYYLANWMLEHFSREALFDQTARLEYYAYLNYPTQEGRSVRVVEPEGKRWTAQLEEDLVDPRKVQTLAWHGHSKGGEATGFLIYANGGSREDFAWLKEQGVETEGAVALVRRYGTEENLGLKVKAAEQAGCVGVLVYSDPKDDGAGQGKTWPGGRWRPESSLQRGGVALKNWVLGDPLSPGWPSAKNEGWTSKDDSPGLPGIPSLPMSWKDAKVLVGALDGVGVRVPKEWGSGTFSGASKDKDSPVVELRNHNDENEKQPIWNVHGMIEGMEQSDRKIIVGSHRDAWCFGAVDSGSGSAVMMEVITIFQKLRRLHWRPLRTIEFISWDASEYNLIGSTEYVEDNIESLRANSVAYLNVDTGISGSDFHASASPVFHKPLLHVLGRVSDPDTNTTLRQLWQNTHPDSHLPALGTSSDSLPFQSLAGTSSIDFGFSSPRDHAYPAASCHDTFNWMTRFSDDSEWTRHRTLAQIWALLILEIADRPLIPFDLNAYARSLKGYINQLEKDIIAAKTSSSSSPSSANKTVTLLSSLHAAADTLQTQTQTFHAFEQVWAANVLGAGRGLESREMALQRLRYNDRVSRFEADLLDLPRDDDDERSEDPHADGEDEKKEKRKYGIPAREQYKHVLFGPTAWGRGADGEVFPAVRDAVEEGDWERAAEMVELAAAVVRRAGARLLE